MRASSHSKNVVIITGDPLSARLAGPAIRAINIATQVSKIHSVRLLSMTGADLHRSDFETYFISPDRQHHMREHIEWADVILVQGYALDAFPELRDSAKPLVVDLYDPIHVEQLEQGRSVTLRKWVETVSDATAVLNEQLIRGDFFICASPRQRDFWLGQLSAFGRINPYTYQDDPNLRNLIDLVPFGISSDAPVKTSGMLRGVIPGIGLNDAVIIWAGGIYDWFDPETLIRAVHKVSISHPEVRLFFMGTAHPNPGVPEMAIVQKARTLAAELGVLGVNVFFNETWVEYESRANYLLDADLGISTHFDNLETEFSFRTRMLDYVWTNLPMISTRGDYFADVISEHNLGLVVPPRDVDVLAAAISELLSNKYALADCAANVATLRSNFYWEQAVSPLMNFIDRAEISPDRRVIHEGGRSHSTVFTSKQRRQSLNERRFREFVRQVQQNGMKASFSKLLHKVGK